MDKKEQLINQILKWIKEDEEKIITLLTQLVQCKTPSIPGDTRDAGKLIENYFSEEEIAYKKLALYDKMPNFISSTKMAKAGRHLMFNGHLDVLPAGQEQGWSDDPWSGKIKDGRIFGRGTSDMKAGVVAMLFAYTYLSRLRNSLRGNLSLSLVSDEETGYGRGTGYLFEEVEKLMVADCVLSAEPSGIDAISFSSKGYMQFVISIETRGSIAGYTNDSKNSIKLASKIIQDLYELESIQIEIPKILKPMLNNSQWVNHHEKLRGKGHADLLAKVTVDISTIEGGSLLGVIPAKCDFSVAIVIPIGMDPYAIYEKVQYIIDKYPEATLSLEGIDSADVTDPDHKMVHILQDTVENLGKKRPLPTPDIAISDCRYWRYRGIPAFWYGPDGSNCSAANESVLIDEVFHIIKTYSFAAITYLLDESMPNNEEKNLIAQKVETTKKAMTILKSVPTTHVVALSGVSKSFKEEDLNPVINNLLKKLYQKITIEEIEIGATYIIQYEMEKLSKGYQVKVIVATPISKKIRELKDLNVIDLPGFPLAVSKIHRGSKNITDTWHSLNKWVINNKYKASYIYREVYIIGAPNPEEIWVTELQQPIVKK